MTLFTQLTRSLTRSHPLRAEEEYKGRFSLESALASHICYVIKSCGWFSQSHASHVTPAHTHWTKPSKCTGARFNHTIRVWCDSSLRPLQCRVTCWLLFSKQVFLNTFNFVCSIRLDLFFSCGAMMQQIQIVSPLTFLSVCHCFNRANRISWLVCLIAFGGSALGIPNQIRILSVYFSMAHGLP